MALFHSRRSLVYYTVVATSFCWILGTVSFFLIQSLDVSIEIKRRTPEEILPLQIPKLNAQSVNSVRDSESNRGEPNQPSETKRRIVPVITTNSEKDTIIPNDSPRKLVFITANYERFPPGAKLKGPGAGGAGISVPASRKAEEDEGFDQHSFNRVASDMISFHRKLRDHRNSG